ncbi:MAG: DUF4178 domain-containing protein [Roseicyclus sp.]|nr:DUF4178 domain-containing protein [Roseicyclus sp.]MBO6624254.1 DUF4178 domain-containing protein [Roseicyclus sp.]MBO6921395.1 DUF4178 domain-containing protein [Roseicyclus sp.]
MTRTTDLSSINCTQCGAGLGVLGGGRVRTHVCGYCGAVLDAQDKYRILTSIGNRDHPFSPVNIGMTATIEGADFTVIGTLGMIETYRGETWRWTEHQLFSPTHGYAWLSYESGAFVFTRKLRDLPSPMWIGTAQVERAESPPRARLNDGHYRYYETSTARIDFMEGEFNWLPKLGESKTAVTLMSREAMLSYSFSRNEREVERSILLPTERICAQLGIDPATIRVTEPHPLTPFKPLKDEGFLRAALLGFAALALFLTLALWMLPGDRVLNVDRVPVRDLPQTYDFTLTSTDQLVRVDLQSDVSNAYALFSTEILNAAGEPVVEGMRAAQYYSGTDGGERWSEGSRRAHYLFRPADTGVHRITLDLEEAESWQGNHSPLSYVTISVRQKVTTSLWMGAMTVVFLLGALALQGRYALYEKRRWSGSDWTDED